MIKIGRGFCIVDHGHWVSSIIENTFDVGYEVIVIDQAVLHSVFCDQLLDFLLGEFNIQCSKTCSELYYSKNNINMVELYITNIKNRMYENTVTVINIFPSFRNLE